MQADIWKHEVLVAARGVYECMLAGLVAVSDCFSPTHVRIRTLWLVAKNTLQFQHLPQHKGNAESLKPLIGNPFWEQTTWNNYREGFGALKGRFTTAYALQHSTGT